MHDPYSLLPVAYRAAAAVARSRVLAEEAGERAIHQLTLAVLEGAAPTHPEAWLRVVARRSAFALLRSGWARTRALPPEDLSAWQTPSQAPPSPRREFVREEMAPALTPRQREALHAALSSNTTRAAARRCNMPPRDFRRYLEAISRRARHIVRDREFDDPFADDANVQFQLGQ
ncbi:MAG: hypothetical protein NXI31_07370 [bacterium]|nr:hypothetical protein [bacterium]